MKPNRYLTLITGPVLAAALTPAAYGTVNLSCDSVNASEVSLWARYVDTDVRRTFDVGIKVPPEGQTGAIKRAWGIFVGDRRIGQVSLTPRSSGTHSSSLSLDSYANDGLAEVGALPFPRGWPGVQAGSVVRAGKLTCQLAD